MREKDIDDDHDDHDDNDDDDDDDSDDENGDRDGGYEKKTITWDGGTTAHNPFKLRRD